MFDEKTISQKTVYNGKIVNLRVDEVTLPNGKTAVREVVEHPGAVVILAKDGDDLLFVRQYRHAVARELLELPAGKLEQGEDPAQAAARELREETGYSCENVLHMGVICPSPGILSEVIHLYFATGLTHVGQSPDDDEFVSVVRVHKDTFVEMLLHSEIIDAKSICAVNIARARGLIELVLT